MQKNVLWIFLLVLMISVKMTIKYEVKNKKLKKMLEKKAEGYHISVDELIWNFINRGLMWDNMNDEQFQRLHSEEFLVEVNKALDVD